MGKNKHIRELIAGQLRTITKHQARIEAEMKKPLPNMDWVKGWEREIDNARRRVRELQHRLGK